MFTSRFLFHAISLSLFILFSNVTSVVAQPFQAWFGAVYNTASYKDFRHERAYEKGIQNPEVYENLGIYAHLYDGSILGMMFNDKLIMIGDYARLAIGGGYVSSQAYQYIDGSGKVHLGQGGVYGDQGVYSPGPISKTKASYIIDVNLGLQLQARLDDDVYFGLRYFWRGQLNPIVQKQELSYKGVFGFFGRYQSFGVVMEHDFNKANNKTRGGITSFSGKYYPWESKFLGFKIESATEDIHHFGNIYTPAKYTYFMLFFGFEL